MATLEEEAARVRAQAEAWLGRHRHRTSLGLEFAGWHGHGDAPVWSLGYYVGAEFRITRGLSRFLLQNHWFPILHRQGITPYITRAPLDRWIAVHPGAY